MYGLLLDSHLWCKQLEGGAGQSASGGSLGDAQLVLPKAPTPDGGLFLPRFVGHNGLQWSGLRIISLCQVTNPLASKAHFSFVLMKQDTTLSWVSNLVLEVFTDQYACVSEQWRAEKIDIEKV